MKLLLTERNIVVILFIMVLITFSFAQNETKRMELLYNGGRFSMKKSPAPKLEAKANVPLVFKSSPTTE
jgi:hypothetical protein